MSRNATEELPGASAPVLSAAVLARIHELNLDYVELLAAEHNAAATGGGQLQHLPCKLHAAIAELSHRLRARRWQRCRTRCTRSVSKTRSSGAR